MGNATGSSNQAVTVECKDVRHLRFDIVLAKLRGDENPIALCAALASGERPLMMMQEMKILYLLPAQTTPFMEGIAVDAVEVPGNVAGSSAPANYF